MKHKVTIKQAIETGIGLGALSKVSRNPKINSMGDILLIFSLIAYLGEFLRFIIVKPTIFFVKWCCKFMWWMCKLTCYYLPKWLIQVSIKIYKYIKIKYEKRLFRNKWSFFIAFFTRR